MNQTFIANESLVRQKQFLNESINFRLSDKTSSSATSLESQHSQSTPLETTAKNKIPSDGPKSSKHVSEQAETTSRMKVTVPIIENKASDTQ